MNKHTPAPWDWVQFFAPTGETTYRIRGKGLLEIARAQGFGPEAEANVRLMAAAPELLEALEWCLEALAAESIDGGTAGELARAAIAKAKGGRQ